LGSQDSNIRISAGGYIKLFHSNLFEAAKTLENYTDGIDNLSSGK